MNDTQNKCGCSCSTCNGNCNASCGCDCKDCGGAMKCSITGWNLKKAVYYIGSLVGVVLFIYLIGLAYSEFKGAKYIGSGVIPNSIISVNGKGEIVTKPDIATFSYSVDEKAKTVDEAQANAATKGNKIIAALKAAGVAETDIKQTYYNINPEYEWTSSCVYSGNGAVYPPCVAGKQVLKGYGVTETVEVKVRDLSKAGTIFQTVGTLGVSNVFGLSFSIDKIDDIKQQARTMAVDDAKKNAEILAKQLGVKLVRITSYYDQCSYGCYGENYSYAREAISASPGMDKAGGATPEIPSGEQKIRSNVTISYEIK